MDGDGNAYVTGSTYSSNFPILDPYQMDQPGWDAFLTRLSSGGNSLVYSTYRGGNDIDYGFGIAVDGSGGAYVIGTTESTDFPTLNPYQTDQADYDVFVAKFGQAAPPCDYLPGDINGDDLRLGGDATYGVRFFKQIGNRPPDSCYMDSTSSQLYVAGDVNGNCEFRGSDITRLVAYFKGNAALSYCHFFTPPPMRDERQLLVPKD